MSLVNFFSKKVIVHSWLKIKTQVAEEVVMCPCTPPTPGYKPVENDPNIIFDRKQIQWICFKLRKMLLRVKQDIKIIKQIPSLDGGLNFLTPESWTILFTTLTLSDESLKIQNFEHKWQFSYYFAEIRYKFFR